MMSSIFIISIIVSASVNASFVSKTDRLVNDLIVRSGNHKIRRNEKCIRFSTGGCDIHSEVFRNGTDIDNDFAGVDWEVFRKITKLMNISIRYVPPSNDTLLGELDENSTPSPTWRGGLLGNLANDLADIAFCGLWIETRKIRGGLQMSKPFQQVCIKYAVPRPGLSNDWSLTINPFRPYVFLGLMISVILVGSTTFIINNMKTVFEPSQIQDFRSWSFCVFTAWGMLVHGNAPQSSPKLGSVRRIIIVWAVVIVIFDCSFSSQLITRLTKLPYEKKPAGIKDLVDLGYEGPYVVDYPWDGILPVEEKYSAEWIKRTDFMTDFNKYVDRLRTKPKQTILGTMYNKNTFVPATTAPIPGDILAKYETMNHCLATVYEGYAFRPGSPFNYKFDRYITLFAEFGLISREMRKTREKLSTKQPVLSQMTMTSSNTVALSPLSLRQLRGIFIAFAVGQMLATLCFFLEVFLNARRKVILKKLNFHR
ncbi:Hypothetical protein NTJ_10442 [Nesidiocoris tenuis]|uniref:Ionotropic glutamate receptor C-terminal domain-containing protein n=1 Tax=Nesidiocoris tenuis TaxID=355587 RepID=A0ABN7B074_9HEMI|nr:Hypothetical protein NTJ_10442 [Nesidiocoris tenuis]